jgi:hypothetical protein
VREERETDRERGRSIYIYIKHGIFVLGQASINFKTCLIKLSFASARRLCLVLADLPGLALGSQNNPEFLFFIFLHAWWFDVQFETGWLGRPEEDWLGF